jgi:hypothetical protein
MPKVNRLLPHKSPLPVSTWTLVLRNSGRSVGRTHTSAAPCANLHVAFSQAKQSKGAPPCWWTNAGSLCQVSCTLFRLGDMHGMLSLDRAYMVDELEGLIVF